MSSSFSNGSMNIEGANVSVTFTPNPGYYIDYITDSAGSILELNNTTPYVFSISSYATRTITCTFGAFSYSLTLTNSAGGSVSANVVSGEYGYSSLLTFSPAYAYEVNNFTVNGVNHPASEVVNNQYTLTNIVSNTTVYANFRRSSNMQACIGGALKRLDMYACVGGALKPIVTKFCIGGVLK